jgi:dihydrofolate synthase / folylpolyglutamate synthase
MEVQAYKTDPVVGTSDLLSLLDRFLPNIQDKSVVAVTSKVVSLCEGRYVPIQSTPDKKNLIHTEAQYFLEDPAYYEKYHISLTIKDSHLIASSGIDESNGNGKYILWPKNSFESAKTIWTHLKNKHAIENLGVIITDSHSTPLRWGVTGTTLAWCGFLPLYTYVGKPDIFGRPFKFEQTSIIDSIATACTLVMGEGNEQTPLAIATDIPFIHYVPHPPTEKEIQSLHIDIKDDIYAPLLTSIQWKKGGTLKK